MRGIASGKLSPHERIGEVHKAATAHRYLPVREIAAIFKNLLLHRSTRAESHRGRLHYYVTVRSSSTVKAVNVGTRGESFVHELIEQIFERLRKAFCYFGSK